MVTGDGGRRGVTKVEEVREKGFGVFFKVSFSSQHFFSIYPGLRNSLSLF